MARKSEGWSAVLLVLAGCGGGMNGSDAGVGCTKDTDCKGDRICVQMVCVEPAADASGARDLSMPGDASSGDSATPADAAAGDAATAPDAATPPDLAVAQGKLPSFAAPAAYGADVDPNFVALGDLNGDQVLDLVASNVNTNDVSVLLGKGDGSFGAPKNTAVATEPGGIAVVDLDRDGKLDVVVADLISSQPALTVTVLYGNGDGTLKPPMVTVGPSNGVATLAVGNLNGDAVPDVALFGGSLTTYVGSGNGTLSPNAPISIPVQGHGAPALGDLDGDGHADVVVCDKWGTHADLFVLIGNGDGTLQQPTKITLDTQLGVAGSGNPWIADFNGDGKADVAVGGKGVHIFLGKGNGTFQPPVSYAAGIPFFLTAADFNGDGILDLAAGSPGEITILVGDGKGGFPTSLNFAAGFVPFGIVAGDLNGDGKVDLVTADIMSLQVLLNTTP